MFFNPKLTGKVVNMFIKKARALKLLLKGCQSINNLKKAIEDKDMQNFNRKPR